MTVYQPLEILPALHTRAGSIFLSTVCLLVLFIFATTSRVYGQEQLDGTPDQPLIAIIIDDLGNNYRLGQRCARLPGPVACAFLPHAPYTRKLARLAHQHGKEVMLHLPMQSMKQHALERGAITLDMEQSEFMRTVADDLAAVPYVVGINNHMGSMITQHPGHMQWLMHAMRRHGGLFFIDSRTVPRSIAQQVANETGVPSFRRDIFLDDDPSPWAVAQQFAQLIDLARTNGVALAIGHPYPATLGLLEQKLPTLTQHGLTLTPVATLVSRYNSTRHAESQPVQSMQSSLAKEPNVANQSPAAAN